MATSKVGWIIRTLLRNANYADINSTKPMKKLEKNAERKNKIKELRDTEK